MQALLVKLSVGLVYFLGSVLARRCFIDPFGRIGHRGVNGSLDEVGGYVGSGLAEVALDLFRRGAKARAAKQMRSRELIQRGGVRLQPGADRERG